MTWNDESQTVTNDRHEAARNPHRATTRSLLAEAYDDGYDGPRCAVAARAGRWHVPHSGACPADVWGLS